MKEIKVQSQNEKQTLEIGKKLGSKLKKGDIVVLTGELGSGKTKLTEGILSYYNLQNEISSPTFTIVNEYNANGTPLYHFDVYRLGDSSEFFEIGGEEYFENGICIIEWGEIIQDTLPKDYIQITFERNFEIEDERILTVKTFGNKYDNYFEEDTI